eukprot:7654305-Karenia_brevis.AAC.1
MYESVAMVSELCQILAALHTHTAAMEAGIGDILPRFQRSRLDDMLKGYIIKIRVRGSERLLLAQPYLPHLFRRGTLPGPQLSQDVLLKKITVQKARKEWQAYEQQEKKKTKIESWPLEQTLPCRCCTDRNKGQEVWKPA